MFCLPNVLDKTDCGSSSSVGVAFLQVTKPVPHSVQFHIVPCSPRARGLEGRLFFLACLQNTPEAMPKFLFSAPAPRQHMKLCYTEAERKCLITILWPGVCCIPQIVYVSCSAHLSWCYFIPAVSKRMTEKFMYSQLIVTSCGSVLAQKANQQVFFSTYK